jgi:transposase
VDRWRPYLEQRLAEGCRNRSQLWREPRTKERTLKCPSPRQLSALLFDVVHHPSPSQQDFAQTLCARSPDLAHAVDLAKQFYRMLRERDASAWLSCRKAARKSRLHHFAIQLHRDEAAVLAALTLPWSTGQVEGHIHRLKLIITN